MTEVEKKGVVAERVAMISVVIGMLCLLCDFIVRRVDVRSGALALVMIGFMAAMCIAGLTLAVIGLCGARRAGRGVALIALTGLILSGFFAVKTGRSLVVGKHISDYVRARRSSAISEYLKYPGWEGVVDHGALKIAVSSIHDESQVVAGFNSRRETPVSLGGFVVVNPPGAPDVVVDATHPDILVGEDVTVPAIPMDEVVKGMKERQDELAKLIDPTRKVAGGTKYSGKIFLPVGFDWSGVSAVVIKVNGEPVRIAGRWLSADDKRAIGGVASEAPESK